MSVWQPIETAPKDGTPVLLWVTYPGWEWKGAPAPEAVAAKWHRPGGRPGPMEYWALIQTGGYAEDDDVGGTPTHWAPLPDPPNDVS